jgi:hypothetical protein
MVVWLSSTLATVEIWCPVNILEERCAVLEGWQISYPVSQANHLFDFHVHAGLDIQQHRIPLGEVFGYVVELLQEVDMQLRYILPNLPLHGLVRLLNLAQRRRESIIKHPERLETPQHLLELADGFFRAPFQTLEEDPLAEPENAIELDQDGVVVCGHLLAQVAQQQEKHETPRRRLPVDELLEDLLGGHDGLLRDGFGVRDGRPHGALPQAALEISADDEAG